MFNDKSLSKNFRAAFWLAEAVLRSFAGWYFLINKPNVLGIIAGVYFLITAVLIVILHFEEAHDD